jgi:hypothetical protein
MEFFSTALDRYFATSADMLWHALTIHRQHLDAARSVSATNDNAAVRELLGELLTGARSAHRGEGLGDAPRAVLDNASPRGVGDPVSAPGVGLGEDSPPPLPSSYSLTTRKVSFT